MRNDKAMTSGNLTAMLIKPDGTKVPQPLTLAQAEFQNLMVRFTVTTATGKTHVLCRVHQLSRILAEPSGDISIEAVVATETA